MNPTIDLTTPGFWLVMLLLALALMTPITHGLLRRWVWAGVNLLFIAWMLKLRCLEVVAGLVVAHLALRMLACRGNRGWRAPVAAVGLAMAIGLFVINKLPDLSHAWGTDVVNPLLLAVGFSYVFLRLIDAGRSGLRRRPTPAGHVIHGQLPAAVPHARRRADPVV